MGAPKHVKLTPQSRAAARRAADTIAGTVDSRPSEPKVSASGCRAAPVVRRSAWLLCAAALLAPHHAAAQGGTAPQITSPPAVTSSPASGDTYGTGETIEFSVTFDAAVTVTGAPRFGFRLKDSGEADSADNFKLAGLVAGGSGTITLRFAYTVQPGDSDDDGISIGGGSETFQLDAGDAIRDAATNSVDAALAHGAPGTQSGHKVRGLPRAPANFRLEPATGTNLRLIWNDPNDSSITNYQYRAKLPAKDDWRPNWTDIDGSDATTTSVVSRNLSESLTIIFELRAENPLGVGPASQAMATTPPEPGTTPEPDPEPEPEPEPESRNQSPNQSPSRSRSRSRRCPAPRCWCWRCCWPPS